LFLVVITI